MNTHVAGAVGGLVGIYMWHGWYLQAPVGMQDQTDALYKLSNAYSSVLLHLRALKGIVHNFSIFGQISYFE